MIEVEIPEWGETVYVRPITAQQRAKTPQDDLSQEDGRLMALGRIIVRAVQDVDGNVHLGDDDIPDLLRHGVLFDRLADPALELNGITKKMIEDAKKNSPTTPSSNSESDSVTSAT